MDTLPQQHLVSNLKPSVHSHDKIEKNRRAHVSNLCTTTDDVALSNKICTCSVEQFM